MKRFSLAMAAFAVAVLVGGSSLGGADPGGSPWRDHGHGAWFERVCDLASGSSAGCDAQVVTDAAGDPLAGGSPPASAYGPAQFHGAYNLPATAAGGATPTVGIVDAYDDPNAEADLATFDSAYGLTACTTANGCFKKVNQTGGTSYPAKNSGWDLEISLDVQTVREICQSCHILLVEATSNSTTNLGIAENEAAALGAIAISNSWGAGESSSETSWDSAYFNHPGVAITASTGDGGYGVEWPASSPDVTAVGGTTLHVAGSNPTYTYGSESAWVDGGSGCSTTEARPSWQAGLGSCAKRSVADVAADADPNTGAAVYDSVPYSGSSGWFQVGGTSLSSPLIASVYALADNTGAITSGATPYAYAGTSALNDVTTGSNGTCNPTYLCTAGPGYDGPTGVGTPNGDTAFSPSPPTPDYSLGVTAQSGTVTSGTGGAPTYTVSVNDLNGFSGAVTLGTGALPTGVSAGFSPNPTGTSSTLTLTVPSTVAAGSYTIAITGVSGSLDHSVNATLTVAPQPDFSLTVGSQVGTVSSGTGGSVSYTVTVQGSNGFAGSVALGTGTLPTGVSLSGFSPNPTGTSSTLTLNVSGSTAQGTFTIPITGTSGSLNHSVSATLKVGPPPSPDFTIAISPSSGSVGSPGSTTYTVTITAKNNFTGTVSLSVSGLPRNVSGSFSPGSVTGGSGTSTLTVTSTRSARHANATFTVKGTSGSLSHTATAGLTVT